ncbi:hypothetical protein [Microbacterium sp. 10M-3C3]|jgi:hypothetical protein|nr:hypothetical protein [Microbacterium sp. 10M-3C3]
MATLIVVLLATWLIVSVGAGLLVGRGITLADRRDEPRRAAARHLTHV